MTRGGTVGAQRRDELRGQHGVGFRGCPQLQRPVVQARRPESESGWGINFAHQGDVIFASWFTYDMTGKGWWLVMTANNTGGQRFTRDAAGSHRTCLRRRARFRRWAARAASWGRPWVPARSPSPTPTTALSPIRLTAPVRVKGHYPPGIRPAADVHFQREQQPRGGEQLSRPVVQGSGGIGIRLGDQLQPSGRHDLCHLVYLRPRPHAHVAGGDADKTAPGTLHRNPVSHHEWSTVQLGRRFLPIGSSGRRHVRQRRHCDDHFQQRQQRDLCLHRRLACRRQRRSPARFSERRARFASSSLACAWLVAA